MGVRGAIGGESNRHTSEYGGLAAHTGTGPGLDPGWGRNVLRIVHEGSDGVTRGTLIVNQ